MDFLANLPDEEKEFLEWLLPRFEGLRAEYRTKYIIDNPDKQYPGVAERFAIVNFERERSVLQEGEIWRVQFLDNGRKMTGEVVKEEGVVQVCGCCVVCGIPPKCCRCC